MKKLIHKVAVELPNIKTGFAYRTVLVICSVEINGFYMITGKSHLAQAMRFQKGRNIVKIPTMYAKAFVEGLESLAKEGDIQSFKFLD
jgi:hypothetical protein